MALDKLKELFLEKGFVRQSVLLESSVGSLYLSALTQKEWEESVKAKLGKKGYDLLLQECTQSSDGVDFSSFPVFERRSFSQPCLDVTVNEILEVPDIEKAVSLQNLVAAAQVRAMDVVYKEVLEQTQSDPELLFRIYKDEDIVARGEVYAEQYLKGKIWSCRRTITRLLECDAPSMILQNDVSRLQKYLPESDYALASVTFFPKDGGEIAEQNYAHYEQTLKEDAEVLTKVVVPLTVGGGIWKRNFASWYQTMKDTQQERVCAAGKEEIEEQIILMNRDAVDVHLNEFALSDIELFLTFEGVDIVATPSYTLLHAPLALRRKFTEAVEEDFHNIRNTLTGFQHILDGGAITNPSVDPVSVFQNHARIPNISYSSDVKSILSSHSQFIDDKMREMPDLISLPLRSRLRKKREYRFVMEELMKNPLDVTFGNDSGCCVFVPETIEELGNGGSVAHYLRDPGVRLFSLSLEAEKKQRMGFVLSFDTVYSGYEGTKVLACNSLELSPFSLPGGRSTLEKLVVYSEDWLKHYAKSFGYSGVAMGSHSYNSSRNYSSHSRALIQEQLLYRGELVGFYSDIFEQDLEKGSAQTRRGALYWLWKNFED